MPPPTAAPLVVHVVGAVSSPGVYNLPEGSRVQDAVQAAGGLLPEANPRAINLAALLQDGERVEIPENQPTQAPQAASLSGSATQPAPGQRTNINTASQEELERLPGIGPVTAQKIIAYRQANGPFVTIEAIQQVSGIGPATFERLKDLITVVSLP